MKVICVGFAIVVTVCSCLLFSSRVAAVISFRMRRLAFATNQFGLDLYRAMDSSQGNIAVCPFCVSSSLAMMLVGAQGNTAMALKHALYLWGLEPRDVNEAYNDLMTHLGANLPITEEARSPLIAVPGGQTTENQTQPNELSFVSSVYVQRDFNIQYPYHVLIQRYYKTAVHPVDFIHNGQETYLHINAIVEKQTGGKIIDILKRQPFPGTSLLLISAFYFRGVVDMELNSIENSKLLEEPSERADNSDRKRKAAHSTASPAMISMRSARIRHAKHRYLNCSAMEIPFKGGILSLMLLMPDDNNGMNLLVNRLNAQVLADVVNGMDIRRVNLKMPRLKVGQRHGNLSFALVKLGLIDLFRPGYANLYEVSDYKWLHVSDIIHEAQVDLRPDSSRRSQPSTHNRPPEGEKEMEITMDKPFLYFVLDNISGLVLVMGKAGAAG